MRQKGSHLRIRFGTLFRSFVDDALTADLIDDIFLPAKARNLVKTVLDTRDRVETESKKLQKVTTDAARVLTEDIGVSMRDAGVILGLSHQRVHQLTSQNDSKS